MSGSSGERERPPAASTRYWIVDAFAGRPFEGNPAAVCIPGGAWPDQLMRDVAAEFNLSETSFLERAGAGSWKLRWFTPTVEVDLCGHATLAAAHTLYESGQADIGESIDFLTRSGELRASSVKGGISLLFPFVPLKEAPMPRRMWEALGVEGEYRGTAGPDHFIEVSDVACLRGIAPDFELLADISERGVIVTCAGTSDAGGCDFQSRFFAPAAGIPEDPVTGSAHCALGPYWGERLKKRELVGRQASRRGGEVRIMLDTSDSGRLRIEGGAVTVASGELYLPSRMVLC